MSKYTLEFKLEVINYYLSGRGGQKQAAKQFGIPRINIRTWVALYERHGKKGLIPQQRRRYTGEFKCTVVEHMYLEKLSIKTTATHFDILFSNVAAWDIVLQKDHYLVWYKTCYSMP